MYRPMYANSADSSDLIRREAYERAMQMLAGQCGPSRSLSDAQRNQLWDMSEEEVLQDTTNSRVRRLSPVNPR